MGHTRCCLPLQAMLPAGKRWLYLLALVQAANANAFEHCVPLLLFLNFWMYRRLLVLRMCLRMLVVTMRSWGTIARSPTTICHLYLTVLKAASGGHCSLTLVTPAKSTLDLLHLATWQTHVSISNIIDVRVH